jgi:Flp pilus assembly protein TadG
MKAASAAVPRRARPRGREPRRGAAALEFAIVCSLLFVVFLGMIEIGRAMMALGAVANAARAGARAGALPGGNYSAATAAVSASISASSLAANPTTTVTVNGTTVGDDPSYAAAVAPGVPVSVQVSASYSDVSWLPSGFTLFLSGSQQLTETVVMRKEG